MKISQKKTCNDCNRALGKTREICELGYKRKISASYNGINFYCTPIEPCPKPKTISEGIYAMKHLHKDL